MKTIQKPLAFLFAILTFAACNDRTIEPARSAQRPQSIVTRLDTISEPTSPKVAGYHQLQSSEGNNESNNLPGCGTPRPVPVGNPVVTDTPRQTVVLDSLAY